MFTYTVNQLLRWGEDSRLERVLWVDLRGDGLYAIDIAAERALPRFWNSTHLDLARSDGQLTLEPMISRCGFWGKTVCRQSSRSGEITRGRSSAP